MASIKKMLAGIDPLVALWVAPCKLQDRGLVIDIDVLVRIGDLFRFRWDPPVLAVLEERPFRFRALLTRLESQVGEHVDDNALSRSLHRLTGSGLVGVEVTPIGGRNFNVYGLTETGHKYLETYGAFIAIYARVEKPCDDCSGCCLRHHHPHSEHTPA